MINRLLRKLPHNAYNQRWGLNSTMTLTDPDGVVYLFRRRLVQTPWFAIYLHDILTPDADRAQHDHPFPFASLVLRGGYVERVCYPVGTERGPVHTILRSRWRMHAFPRGNGQIHRIDVVLPKTKTLVFAGRRKDSWGFWVEGTGIRHWKEYLDEQGRDHSGARRVTNS